MAKYNLRVKKSAQKEISSLPKTEVKKILEAIMQLQEDPFGPNCKKLSGDDKYRKRVGRYRILYQIINDELVIFIVKGAHRKNVYKK